MKAEVSHLCSWLLAVKNSIVYTRDFIYLSTVHACGINNELIIYTTPVV